MHPDNRSAMLRAIEVSGRGEWDEFVALLHPEVEVIAIGEGTDLAGPGTAYRGRVEARAWLAGFEALFDVVSAEVREWEACGEAAAQDVVMRGRLAGGEELTRSWPLVWEFDAGLPRRCAFYDAYEDALAAIHTPRTRANVAVVRAAIAEGALAVGASAELHAEGDRVVVVEGERAWTCDLRDGELARVEESADVAAALAAAVATAS